jgi:flavodoxin
MKQYKDTLVFLLISVLLLGFLMVLGNGRPKSVDSVSQATPPASRQQEAQTDLGNLKGKKILIAYFSRAGENYQVGYIQKGNTHIVADMIAQETGGTLFEIRPAEPYPDGYQDTTRRAQQEKQEQARPKLTGDVPDWDSYDVVFLGYPIWWSDAPMIVYTFLESHDFTGKIIIPFCTSAGDVLTGQESSFPQHAKGVVMAKGFGVEGKRAQQQPETVSLQVHQWLKGLGFPADR